MTTKRISRDIETAAKLLREGSLVAVPTETVYGLAGNGLDERVIESIYEVKGRPAVKPISLMVPGPEMIDELCMEVPEAAWQLAERFWPGPLTLVLRARPSIPDILRAGGTTVGLRCPRQEKTLRLLREVEFPLAVPSANPSGLESPKDADQVLAYFDGKIAAVIDGGPCALGLESTVLDLSQTPYRILRQGSLPAEEIMDALVSGMTIVGITGGSGCGKTTALLELENRGALLLDCDAVYHELLNKSESLIAELEAAFPGTTEGGVLQRDRLGEIVFRDEGKLKRLNEITHRHIMAEVTRRLRAWAMEGGKLAALDAIELISSGLAEICDFTIAIIASDETRISRIMARDGIGREKAELRIRAQRPNSYFIEHCDFTVSNDGDSNIFIRNLNEELEKGLRHGKHERESVL